MAVRHERREHEDGSYSEALIDEEHGSIEVTQYDREGNVVGRTYGSTHESEDDDAGGTDPGVAPLR